MIFGRGYGRSGDELTWDWLNNLLKLARTNRINAGPNSGLAVITTAGVGTSIRVTQSQLQPVFFCQPGSAVAGATGTWPAITPASFTADIYTVSGSAINKTDSDATVYNWYAAGLDANKITYVVPDGSGAYVAVAESCT